MISFEVFSASYLADSTSISFHCHLDDETAIFVCFKEIHDISDRQLMCCHVKFRVSLIS